MAPHGARVLVAVGVAGVVMSIVAAAAAPSLVGSSLGAWMWVSGAVVPVYLIGTLALTLRPEHLTARWLAAVGSLLALATALNRFPQVIGGLDGVGLMATVNALQVAAMLAGATSIASLLVVFPDPEYRRPYQRHLIRLLWLPALAIPAVWVAAHPYLYGDSVIWAENRIVNPLFVSALSPIGAFAEAGVRWRAVVWLVGAAAFAFRYRTASTRERELLKWPLVAAVVFALSLGLFRFLGQLELVPAEAPQGLPQFSGWVPGLGLLTGSMLIALVRHRLLQVDLWLRRSLLVGGVSAVIAVGYLGLAGVLGLAAGKRASLGVGVVVTLAAVAAFEPARRRVEVWSRRLVLGHTVPGDELLRRMGAVLEDAHDTAPLLSSVATTIVDGLELEWVRISLSAGGNPAPVPAAAVGVGSEDDEVPDLVVPMTHAGETVGFIECGPKLRGELSKVEEELLATVGRQVSLAVRNAGLAAELEGRLDELHTQAEELSQSRSRIVQAQMGERRRIERDIHDGVQQDIVASIAAIRLARNQVERDPDSAAATLVQLQGHAKRMLASLREVSRGIHPLVLTHHGLVEALDAQAGRLPIDVHLEPDPQVRRTRYSEEIEAAAYFMVLEGLTNVIKHGEADSATVRLESVDGHLIVEVADEGRGCDPAQVASSGIVGLRDRVESLGGTLEFNSRPGAGALLRAELPARGETVGHV